MGARIRQGLSHMLDVPTTPEEVTCSPLSETTCLPNRLQCPTRSSGAVVSRPMATSSHHVPVSFTHQHCKTETLIYQYLCHLRKAEGGLSGMNTAQAGDLLENLRQ